MNGLSNVASADVLRTVAQITDDNPNTPALRALFHMPDLSNALGAIEDLSSEPLPAIDARLTANGSVVVTFERRLAAHVTELCLGHGGHYDGSPLTASFLRG